jgi:ubiquilin
MQNMMDSLQFLQQMTASLQDPAVIDRIIAMNPQLAAMGPQVREMFQNERFRQIL